MDSRPIPTDPSGDASAEAIALQAEITKARDELADLRRDLQRERERESLLRGELQHRVRNMLAVVRSIFMRSVAAGGTLEDLADHFSGRLDVLARYQLIRTNEPEGSADFEAMIRDELQTAAAARDTRIALEGPEVRIAHEVAQFVALTIHEMFTNSIKFGVLSSPAERARLSIRWSVADEVLEIAWSETGVAIVAPAPVRVGFGRNLIEEALPYQLNAKTSFDLAPGELSCTIAIPLNGSDRSRLPWR